MATTSSPPRPPDPSSHYAAQFALASAFTHTLDRIFGLIDPLNLKPSLDRYFQAAKPVLLTYARASRGISAQQYTAARTAAGFADRVNPGLVELPPDAQIKSSIEFATRSLWSSDGGGITTADAVATARDMLPQVLMKPVLDTGRRQTVETVSRDRKATGWAREARADACWFCRMMSIRGAAYSSKASAGADANAKFVGTGNFKFHNNCHCTVVPVFGVYEPTARQRQWKQDYNEATSGITGSKAKQRAYQESVAGRPIKFRDGKKAAKSKPRGPLDFDSMTADQVARQIEVTSGLPESAWKTKYLEKLQARASALAA